MEPQDNLEHREQQEHRVSRDLLVPLVYQVQPVLWDLPVQPEHPVSMVNLDLLVPLDDQEVVELPDLWVPLDLLDLRVSPDQHQSDTTEP